MFGNDAFGTVPFASAGLSTQPIDSSRWTGLPTAAEITEARREKLAKLTDKAISDLELIGAGNEEKAQARSYLIALHALSEAPSPPSDLIWTIIERGMALVGVCELFYKIAEALAN